MDDRFARSLPFWTVARGLLLAWIATFCLVAVGSWVLLALSGTQTQTSDLPWIFGDGLVERLAAAPLAMIGIALLTAFARAVLPAGASGERPAWLPLALVLALTSGIGIADTQGSASDEGGISVVMWLVATALVRRVPWRAAPADSTRRLPRWAIGVGTAAAVALLAAPVAYATLHPLRVTYSTCTTEQGEGCLDGRGRPYASVHLRNTGDAPVRVLELEPEDLPPGLRVVAVTQRRHGQVTGPTDVDRPLRLPAPVDDDPDGDGDGELDAQLVIGFAAPCSRGDRTVARTGSLRVRYEVRGRTITDTIDVDRPARIDLRCRSDRR